MPTVTVEAEISRDELLKAVDQLSPPELSQFVSQVLALRARREVAEPVGFGVAIAHPYQSKLT